MTLTLDPPHPLSNWSQLLLNTSLSPIFEILGQNVGSTLAQWYHLGLLTGSSGFESRLGHYCKNGVGIESTYFGSLWFKVQYGGWLGRLKHVEWVTWL